jgi:hypothetical protein
LGSLSVSGVSSNAALVPDANIVFNGSGANRTVTITPASDQVGTTTITVTVSDGSDFVEKSFLLTVTAVNDAPLADDQAILAESNNPESITLTANDVDGDL